MRNLFLLSIFLWICLTTFSQTIVFEKTYGGTGVDKATSAQQTADGGYVIVGNTTSFGTGVYVVKTDANGNEEWSNTYDNMAGEMQPDIQQTSDGGYIISGDNNQGPCVLTKLNSSGDILWTSSISVYLSGTMRTSVVETNNGYAVTGFDWQGWTPDDHIDIFLAKVDLNGNQVWLKHYGDTIPINGINEIPTDLIVTSDGGFFITGLVNHTNDDIYLIRTDANGDTLWTNTISIGANIYGWSGKETSDGGYIIAGTKFIDASNLFDVLLLKLNSIGDTIWTKTFGGSGNEEGWFVQQASDGGYIIAGETQSFGSGAKDVYLIKTDANGNALWTKTFGGTNDDMGNFVQQTSDNGYVIAGYTKSMDAGEKDFYLLKIDSLGAVNINNVNIQVQNLNIHPNPMKNSTVISFGNQNNNEYQLLITDITGKTVRIINNIRGNKVKIYKQDLNSGLYIVEIRGEKIYRSKMIIN